MKSLSQVRLLATPWTAAFQAPPSARFSRQEYWSGVPLPAPIYIHVSPLFLISFPFKSPQSTEWRCYTVGLWRRQWHPTPVLLPGKSHGRRSLVGCSPWGREESDMTERLPFHFSLFCTGEGNGNPLQCSCLENPRDRGAWWASVYGVAQSWT